MEYLLPWSLFLENTEPKDIDDKDNDTKKKQDLIAKQVIDQLKSEMGNKNPNIKIKNTDKELSEINEASAVLDMVHYLSTLARDVKDIEMLVYRDSRILTSAKDVKLILERFFKENKKINLVFKVCQAIYKAGRWVISWFETLVVWIVSNIFGFEPSNSNLLSKTAMLGLTVSTLAVVFDMFKKELSVAISTDDFTTLITNVSLKLGVTLLLCNKVYSTVKRLIEVYKVKKSDDVLTISELFDHFDKKFVNNIPARDLQKLAQWYEDLDEESTEYLTEILDILKITSDKRIDRFKTVPYLNYHFGLTDKKSENSLEDFIQWLQMKITRSTYKFHDQHSFWRDELTKSKGRTKFKKLSPTDSFMDKLKKKS